VQLFAEVKRHKPSVIYIPGIDTWYHTLSDASITTFLGLLNGIAATEPILVLGIADCSLEEVNPELVRSMFGYSKRNTFAIQHPTDVSCARSGTEFGG
jgi:SpoVK/Ycf46/Vps4 family AAA+-type ATPase